MRIRRITQIYNRFIPLKERADVFFSFAPCGDRLIGVFRRFKLADRAHFEYESVTMLQEFDPEAGVFLSEPVTIMDPGEDPRCFAIGDRPFVLSTNPPGASFNYVLFDVNARKAVNIIVESEAEFAYGKNWQPYVLEGELYVVHELNPFRILHIDVDTGKGRIVFERDLGFGLKSRYDGYACYRGGCSALSIDGNIVGFGHFTSDPGRHELFQWTFSPQAPKLSVSLDFDLRPLRGEGMAIFDPTCFFRFRGGYYLGLTCSNREWFYGQKFISALVELEDSAASSPKSETASASLLPHNFFRRAVELQVEGGRALPNFEVIATAGVDQPGCLLRGGPPRIAPGRYQLAAQYAVPGDSAVPAGSARVFASQGQVCLAAASLHGSGGKLLLAEATFEVQPDQASTGLEIRIDWTGMANLRVTDVAIREEG